jgi:hypothetical protein
MYGRRNYRFDTLTKKEHLRFNEVLFFLLIDRLLKLFADYTTTFNFIEATSNMFLCNPIIIHKTVTKIIQRDMSYLPRDHEMIIILYRAKLSIRDIMKLTDFSFDAIYKVVNMEKNDVSPIEPKATVEEDKEIKKFLLGFRKLKEVI